MSNKEGQTSHDSDREMAARLTHTACLLQGEEETPLTLSSIDHQEATRWTGRGGAVIGQQEEHCRVWSLLLHTEHSLSLDKSPLGPIPPCSREWEGGACSASSPHTCIHEHAACCLPWAPWSPSLRKHGGKQPGPHLAKPNSIIPHPMHSSPPGKFLLSLG